MAIFGFFSLFCKKIIYLFVEEIMKIFLILVILFLFSCGDSSVDIEGYDSSGSNSNSLLYCDFGPVTQYGGGCFAISDASECDTQWGEVVNACGSNSSGGSNNNGGGTTQQAANAVVLTLTYWQTKDTDVGGLDPRIHFKVTAYKDKKSISSNNSNTLLDAENISATWAGSKKSSPIPFASQADSVTISAVVIEKDTFSDDDISPGYYVIFYPPFYDGRSGSHTLDYGYGLSKVSFNYEFIRQ
jgi:hypothetical protein